MLNKVILIGRLTREPELRYTTGGRAIATFTLAVDRPYTPQNGEKETDFIKIVAWGKLGEAAAQNLGKGRLVAVDGRLQVESYEKDGTKRLDAKVFADSIRYLSWPKKDGDKDSTPEDFMNNIDV